MTEIIENFIDPEIQYLIKPIGEIHFACLFSILCFSQNLTRLYRDGVHSCLSYDHPSGFPSLKCSVGFNFEKLNDINLHTLAIYGKTVNNKYFNPDLLSRFSVKNVIFKDMKVDGLSKWTKYGYNNREMRQSLTLIDTKLDSGLYNFNFYHIYIERSDLSSRDTIMNLILPAKLRSLSLVSCLIEYLPSNFFAQTKSLQMLTITRNSLRNLEPTFFTDNIMESLWFLDLSFNQISHIYDGLITYFPNLAEINLRSNHIQVLPEHTFFRAWIDIDIVNLDANALICDSGFLKWSSSYKQHPIFFDSATCTKDINGNFITVPIGSL